ncbi:MAG: HEAT repeat domain-containing protein [Planctomycetales bacterium]
MSKSTTRRGWRADALGQLLLAGVLCLVVWILWTVVGRGRAGQPASPSALASERFQSMESIVARGTDAVPELLEALRSTDPQARHDAILALGRIGTAARSAAPDLRQMLIASEPHLRAQALVTLARVDRGSAETTALLVQLLGDSEAEVRHGAEVALIDVGSACIPAVLPLLTDPRSDRRMPAIRVMQHVGEGSAEVAQALRQIVEAADSPDRDAAIIALMNARHATLPEVIGWMHHDDPMIVRTAISCLPRFGAEASAALPELVSYLDTTDPTGLPSGLTALRTLKGSARPATGALVRLLEAPTTPETAAVLYTLHDIGADRDTMLPVLERFVMDRDRHVAEMAGRLLSQLDPAAARRQAQIIAERLAMDDQPMVAASLAALFGLGREAAVAVPHLIPLLRDGPTGTREHVATVLQRIGPGAAPAVPEIVTLLEQREFLSRLSLFLIEACGSIGPGAEPVVPLLVEIIALRSPPGPRSFGTSYRDRVACAAMEAGAGIGSQRPELRDALSQAVVDGSTPVKMVALQCLIPWGTQDVSILALLCRALQDESVGARIAATQVLGSIGATRPEATRGLAQALEDQDFGVRIAAAVALGRLEGSATDALPALRSAMEVEENAIPRGNVLRQRRSMNPALVVIPPGFSMNVSVTQSLEWAIGQITAGAPM